MQTIFGKLGWALFWVLWIASPASAHPDDANEALPGCKQFIEIVDKGPASVYGKVMSAPDAFAKAHNMGMNIGVCLGIIRSARYIRDIKDPAMQAVILAAAAGSKATNYCKTRIPQRVTLDQLVRTVIRYIDKRPDRLHEPLISIAEDAFEEVWPLCN
jgi:hypothetical protein